LKYLQKEPFSVPVAGPSVSQEDWDAIFAPKCPECGKDMDTYPNVLRGHVCKVIFDGTVKKGKKGKKS